MRAWLIVVAAMRAYMYWHGLFALIMSARRTRDREFECENRIIHLDTCT